MIQMPLRAALLLVFLTLLATSTLRAQVGIGVAAPEANAMLEVTSTTRGLLIPRLTTAQRTGAGSLENTLDAVAGAANRARIDGMLVYDINFHQLFYYDEAASAWVAVSAGGAGVGYGVAAGQNTALKTNFLFNVTYPAGFGTASGAVITSNGEGGANGATGLSINATTTGTGNTTGLVVGASGGTNNYAALFNAGNVGIGVATPINVLEIRGLGTGATVPSSLRIVPKGDNTDPAATAVGQLYVTQAGDLRYRNAGGWITLGAAGAGPWASAAGSVTLNTATDLVGIGTAIIPNNKVAVNYTQTTPGSYAAIRSLMRNPARTLVLTDTLGGIRSTVGAVNAGDVPVGAAVFGLATNVGNNTSGGGMVGVVGSGVAGSANARVSGVSASAFDGGFAADVTALTASVSGTGAGGRVGINLNLGDNTTPILGNGTNVGLNISSRYNPSGPGGALTGQIINLNTNASGAFGAFTGSSIVMSTNAGASASSVTGFSVDVTNAVTAGTKVAGSFAGGAVLVNAVPSATSLLQVGQAGAAFSSIRMAPKADNTDPSSADVGQLYVRQNGDLYYRNAATWINLGAGGASGVISDPNGTTGTTLVGNTLNGALSSTSNGNTFVGFRAGEITSSTLAANGIANTFIGSLAGTSNTIGYSNVALGAGAAANLDDGYANVLLGADAGQSLTSGNNNIGIGAFSASGVTSGIQNIYIGNSTGGVNGTGSGNVAIGYASYSNANSGTNNVMLGINTGRGAGATFSNNVLIGADAGINVTTGSDNTLVGSGAGSTLLAGTNNTAVGNQAATIIQGGSFNVMIGDGADTGDDFSSTVIVGANARGNGNGAMAIGADSRATANGIAIGGGAEANGNNSVAIGRNVATSQDDAIVLGDGSHNVGIGTTAPDFKAVVVVDDANSNNLSTALAIDHADNSGAVGDGIGSALIFRSESSNNATFETAALIAGQLTDASTGAPEGALIFQTRNIGAMTEHMRIAHTGNVGIGTINPTFKLEVTRNSPGTTHIVSNNLNSAGVSTVASRINTGLEGLDMTYYGSTHAGGPTLGITSQSLADINTGAANGLVIRNYGNAPIVFGTNGAERMRITNTGEIRTPNIHNNGGTGGPTAATIASGTYAPGDLSSSPLNVQYSNCQWMRVGNVVTVSGGGQIQPSGAGGRTFDIDLPINTVTSGPSSISGVGYFENASSGNIMRVQGADLGAISVARVNFTAIDNSIRNFNFSFTYVILP